MDDFKFIAPLGKTPVILTANPYQEDLKKGDICYIDGYVRGGDDRPYAVLVRLKDGLIGHASTYQIKVWYKEVNNG